jgi:hypothetical protein
MKKSAPTWPIGIVAAVLPLWVMTASWAWAIDVGWMQKGVRLWYLGAVDGGGVTSSNAEEAYRIDRIEGNNVRLTHHSALDHWNSPRPADTGTYPLDGNGACWVHPQALQILKMGDFWMGQEITLVVRSIYTYDTFPYHLLPAKVLFDLNPQREIVKISFMIAGFSVGNAYFDADTGILLYYHTLWGANKMFFILSEINYDFARRTAFSEDDGPHTGFKSFVSEQSMKPPGVPGGGSVIIQSLVETRYGDIIEMRVLSSFSGSTGGLRTADENYCFFGRVPIVRAEDAATAPNFPPEQWNPRGEYLWWWVPVSALGRASINVFEVAMSRNPSTPFMFTASESPQDFYFSDLWFGSDGYMTRFAAKDAQLGIDLSPEDYIFQNLTTVHGLDYYRNVMKRAIPANPNTPSLSLPGMLPLLLD